MSTIIKQKENPLMNLYIPNKELLDDNGRIVNVPDYTETVTYTLTVKNNTTGEEKELKFSSIIHGLYTL